MERPERPHGIPSVFGTVDYELGRRYTWADVEQAARTSGLLAQVVSCVHAEFVSREDALCTAIMYLAEGQVRRLNEQAERLSLELPAPQILRKEGL